MARIGSAYPRERHAPAQATLSGLGKRVAKTLSSDVVGSERSLQAAAGLHLFAIAAAVFGPTSPPLPILLTVTGLALVVLSLTRPSTALSPAHDAGLSPPETENRTIALERQSQRLVEIADCASRARREAETRGQLWAELTARMSHELRTPLNAVIGFSDLMNAELFGPLGHDRYRDYARHIRECSRGLLKSTEDTLALTSTLARRDGAEAVRTLDLVDLVNDAVAFHAAEIASRGLTLTRPDAASLEIVGEQRPIRQILVNLIAEAVERTRRGGRILIGAEDDGVTVALSITVERALPRADVGQAPLSVCIARVLLEQQGSGLLETDDHEIWQAATFFDRAAQADFFNSRMAASANAPQQA
jgi:signal transduction histidine kinase